MVAAVEKEMEARAMGISLTPEERFEVFGEHDPAQYDAEVEERWGETDAYAQSKRRTAAYTKDDWVRIKAEGEDIEARFAAALRSGVPADSAQAMDLAEEHRQQISRNFYDCPPEMHAGLGRMYVEDERFTAHYEQRAPGLAQYVSDRRPGQRRPPGVTVAGIDAAPSRGRSGHFGPSTAQTRISSSPCSMPSQPSSAAAQRSQAAAISSSSAVVASP